MSRAGVPFKSNLRLDLPPVKGARSETGNLEIRDAAFAIEAVVLRDSVFLIDADGDADGVPWPKM
jgi:hypothetical protein